MSDNKCVMGFVISGDKCWKCHATSAGPCGKWVTAAAEVVKAVRIYLAASLEAEDADCVADAFKGLQRSIHYLDKKPRHIEARP